MTPDSVVKILVKLLSIDLVRVMINSFLDDTLSTLDRVFVIIFVTLINHSYNQTFSICLGEQTRNKVMFEFHGKPACDHY